MALENLEENFTEIKTVKDTAYILKNSSFFY